MTAAAFTGWQFICAQTEKPPSWDKYLKSLGLADDNAKVTKEDLKREAEQAMANVERIRKQFRKAKQHGGR